MMSNRTRLATGVVVVIAVLGLFVSHYSAYKYGEGLEMKRAAVEVSVARLPKVIEFLKLANENSERLGVETTRWWTKELDMWMKKAADSLSELQVRGDQECIAVLEKAIRRGRRYQDSQERPKGD